MFPNGIARKGYTISIKHFAFGKTVNLVEEKYEDFLELSCKQLNTITSNFPWSDDVVCVKNQVLMLLVSTLGIFCIQKELFRCQSNPVQFKR